MWRKEFKRLESEESSILICRSLSASPAKLKEGSVVMSISFLPGGRLLKTQEVKEISKAQELRNLQLPETYKIHKAPPQAI